MNREPTMAALFFLFIYMKKLYLQLHRRLALIVSIPVLLWALSGILHPLMGNWFKAEIPHRFFPPSALSTTGIKPPEEVLPRNQSIDFLTLTQVHGKEAYLVQQDEKFTLYNATSGQKIPLEDYLLEKARAYTDLPEAELESISRIDAFNNLYSSINRYLPVYRVRLKGENLQVVIDPRTGKLVRYDLPHIRMMKTLFGWFHTYSFLGADDSLLRSSIVVLLSFLSLSLGVSGIVNLITLRAKLPSGKKRKMTPYRRLHRSLGAFAFLFYILFGLSALFHALMKLDYDHSPQYKFTSNTQTNELTTKPSLTEIKAPIFSVTLAQIGAESYYRIQAGKELFYQNVQTGDLLSNGEQLYLETLTKNFTQQAFGEEKKGTNLGLITSFSNEYGFISRRLPVWKVLVAEGTYLYIDTKDNALSKVSTPLMRAEGFSFSMLHKLHFIDPLNKQLRDWVSVIGAGSIALTATFGLILLILRSRSKQSPHMPR